MYRMTRDGRLALVAHAMNYSSRRPEEALACMFGGRVLLKPFKFVVVEHPLREPTEQIIFFPTCTRCRLGVMPPDGVTEIPYREILEVPEGLAPEAYSV